MIAEIDLRILCAPRDRIGLANALLTVHFVSDGAPVTKMRRVEMWHLSFFLCDMRWAQQLLL